MSDADKRQSAIMLKLASAVLSHMRLAVCCRHDGAGLPTSFLSPLFPLLFLVACVAYTTRMSWSADNWAVVIAAAGGFTVSILIAIVFSGRKLIPFIYVFLLASTCVDVMMIADLLLAGGRIPDAVASAWKVIAFLVGMSKVNGRLDQQQGK